MSSAHPSAVQSKVVVSSVNRFHSSVVDLRPIRTIHAIDHRSCVASSSSRPVDCNAIHFGFCSPVKQLYPYIVREAGTSDTQDSLNVLKSLSSNSIDLTSFSLQSTPRTSLLLDQPIDSVLSDFEGISTTPRSSLVLGSGYPVEALSSLASTPANAIASNPVETSLEVLSCDSTSSAKLSNEIKLDTIDILSADVQSNLQALVSSFVARDKVNRRSANSDPQPNRVVNNSSCFSPTSTSSIVFSEYIAPGTDFNKSRVKKAAAAFNKTSEKAPDISTQDIASRRSPETISSPIMVIATSNGHSSSESLSTATDDPQTKCVTKPIDESRIIRRHKKKVATSPKSDGSESIQILESIDTEQVIKKCEEIVSDIVPTNGSLDENKDSKDRTMSRVDYAKNRLQTKKIEDYRHQVRCDNGLTQPSGHKVSEARQRWEHSAAEMSLQQQMFNALGINVLKTSKSPEIPHPKLTLTQKQHIRDRSSSPTAQLSDGGPGPTPVMPFLSKGSVAERVMLFEKAPERLALDNLANTSASSRVRPAMWRTIGTVDYSVKFQVS